MPIWMEGQIENKQKSLLVYYYLVYYLYQTKQIYKYPVKHTGDGDYEMFSGRIKLVN